MSTAPSARPSAPVRVGPLALTDLMSAAVENLLGPYADRATFEPDPGGAYDVGLIDPDLLPAGWVERSRLPLVAITRDGSADARRRAHDLGAEELVGPDLTVDDLLRRVEAARRRADGDEHALSARETEVVSMICRGASNQQIARALFLSPNSIKTYIRSAYRKMGVHTRSQAVLWGVRRGL